MKYAQVIVFRKLGAFDSELTYKISESCNIGDFVEVPFMKQALKGMAVSITDSLPDGLSDEKIKLVKQVLPIPPIPEQSVELARFIADYYKTSLSRALRLFLPASVWKGNIKIELYSHPEYNREARLLAFRELLMQKRHYRRSSLTNTLNFVFVFVPI